VTEPGQLLFAGFEGPAVPDDLAELIRAGRVGGVVLFARNVADPDLARDLVGTLHALAPAAAPLVVAIDQEGGRVQRLRAPWTVWPPARRLGEAGSVDATRAVASALGTELAALGIDLDFAPVVDVDTNPANPVIGDRSFSADPGVVARHAAVFIEALQEAGVAACAKHFPGHGDTVTDSHETLPRLPHDLARLEAVELPPFRAAVVAGVASVMVAHIVFEAIDPERPATLSPPVLGMLRRGIGFDGLVFSDDLDMKAVAGRFDPEAIVRDGLAAGIDAFLACRDPERRRAVLRALEAAPARLLEPSLRRMDALKRRFAGGRRVTLAGGPPYPAHQALAGRLA
jgi:beta-N-acetylhexosaminidase